MTFLNPAIAAAGLACIAIPIIIHLLMRRRRKPVAWAAMRFLLEAYKKHRRRLTLEQLLLLLARCALVALIGLALAQPLLRESGFLGARGAVTVYIMVDNSLTSSATDADGDPALASHLEKATRFLGQLDPARGDRAGIVTLARPAQGLIVPASSDLGAVRAVLEEIEPADSAMDLHGALSELRSHLEGDEQSVPGDTLIAVLSDFLTGSAPLDRQLPIYDQSLRATILAPRPAVDERSNVTISGLEPVRAVLVTGSDATQHTQVRVQLRRTGPGSDQADLTRVRVAVQDDPSPPGLVDVRWAPGQTEATAIVPVAVGNDVRLGEGRMLVATIDRDSIANDNAWRRPIEVREVLRIGLVAPRRFTTGTGFDHFSSADWLRLAMTPSAAAGGFDHARPTGNGIELHFIDPDAIDAARLAGLDGVAVTSPDSLSSESWQRLRDHVDGGGLVVVVPPADASVHVWTDELLQTFDLDWTIAREAAEHPEGLAIAAERSPAAGSDLLEMIDAELVELGRPVRIWKALHVDASRSDAIELLTLADGSPLALASQNAGRGQVVFLATALDMDWTDLPARPLMVPLVHELLRQGIGAARGSGAEVAGSTPPLPGRAVELRRTDEVVQAEAGVSSEPLRHAGTWRAVDERGVTLGRLAINADPDAGRTEIQDAEAIRSWLTAVTGPGRMEWIDVALARSGESQSVVEDGRASVSLPLLIAALAVACVELLLARWVSHATIEPVAKGGVP